ncbi:transcriptional regulator, TrmB [Methanolobus psychrophilus R15]|nr:transcriptional regulator, TrmB [Methanolobus psychrophilus R15]
MNELIESLQQLGLTSYEAKALIALTQYGSGTAADIHALSGIPRSAVYGVITKLKDRGIIETQNTKPMRYKSIPPDRVIDILKEDYEKAIRYSQEQLEDIYRAVAGNTEEDAVWNINGVKNVNDKIVQMLESARKEVIFASSYQPLNRVIKVYPIMESLKDTVQKKINEGVKVKLTGRNKSWIADISKQFPGIEARAYDTESSHPLKGGILVVDDREILVLSVKDDGIPLNLTATWYNGKEQVHIFRHFIEAEWDTSSPVDIKR